MGPSRFVISSMVVLLCISMGADLVSGQVQAPSPGSQCSAELSELLPCLDYLTNPNTTLVSPSCCGGLKNVSITSPPCLCYFISSNQTADLGINDTRAIGLPGSCNLNLSPASCNVASGPAAPVPVLGPSQSPTPPRSPAPVIAPVSAPGAQDCQTVQASLTPCMQYLTGTEKSPSTDCCRNLGDAVETAPNCLCSLVSSGPTVALVNVTLALQLPSECKVNGDPLNQCMAMGSASAPGFDDAGNAGAKLEAFLKPVTVIALAVAMIAYHFCNDLLVDSI